MDSSLDVIKVLVGGVVGFGVKVLHSRVTDKRVLLRHSLETSGAFGTGPSSTVLANLRIVNSGRLPANNTTVVLSTACLRDAAAEFVTISPHATTAEQGDYTLVTFPVLCPGEGVTIAFKATQRFAANLLVEVKSAEVLSTRVDNSESLIRASARAYDVLAPTLALIAAGAAIGTAVLSRDPPRYAIPAVTPTAATAGLACEDLDPNGLATPLVLETHFDRSTYRRGETAQLHFSLTNRGKAPAADIEVLATLFRDLPPPGKLVAWDSRFTHVVPHLAPGETATWQLPVGFDGSVSLGLQAVRASAAGKGALQFAEASCALLP
jgi:hypothetical protein